MQTLQKSKITWRQYVDLIGISLGDLQVPEEMAGEYLSNSMFGQECLKDLQGDM